MIRRREFIAGLGSAAAWPMAAPAQQPAVPVIGFLGSLSPDETARRARAFQQGLSESGFVIGRNVAIEWRWAEGMYDRLPALAGDLVRRQVAVMIADGGIPAALAAKAATASIPIVFFTGADPVASGLVASLNRPGGNLTGATSLNQEAGPKRLELLHDVIPTATDIAALFNPTNPSSDGQAREMQAVAPTIGIKLHVLEAASEADFDAIFAAISRLRAGALVISPDTTLISPSRNARLAALAARVALPTISFTPEFVEAGGLMSYGNSGAEAYRTMGFYAARILKGEKPADLPVQQSTKVELLINMKTAKALGVTFPLALLALADEVVE